MTYFRCFKQCIIKFIKFIKQNNEIRYSIKSNNSIIELNMFAFPLRYENQHYSNLINFEINSWGEDKILQARYNIFRINLVLAH